MKQTVEDVAWVAEANSFYITGARFTEFEGPVTTGHGIVAVTQGGNWSGDLPWGITLQYAIGGQHYQRTIRRMVPYSKRHIVTLARRFAEERFLEFFDDICV